MQVTALALARPAYAQGSRPDNKLPWLFWFEHPSRGRRSTTLYATTSWSIWPWHFALIMDLAGPW